MKQIIIFCLVALSLATGITAFAGNYDQSTPLSARLDQWPYPYPTHEKTVLIQGVAAQMVWMDVKAEGTEKGVVVLFHGKNFGSDYWAPTIAGLSQSGYRVIAPDQIGFGKSSKPDIEYHFDDLARLTKSLLNDLKIKQVNVIANSMGGMLGVRFARLYPNFVQKMVLENPLGLEDYSQYIPPQKNLNLLKLEMAQTENSFRNFLKSYFPNWDSKYERFVEIYARVQKGPEYAQFSKASVLTYQMIDEKPIVKDLPLLNMPTLLIIGQKDRTVFGRRFAPPESVKALGNFPKLGKLTQQIIPHAQLIEVEQSGHVPHLEVPDFYNQSVIQFFQQ